MTRNGWTDFESCLIRRKRRNEMTQMVVAVREGEARVNVTYAGQNGDLRDPVPFDSADGDVITWVTEAVRGGSVANIPASPAADFRNFVVERFSATEETPFNRITIRPKTPFGV